MHDTPPTPSCGPSRVTLSLKGWGGVCTAFEKHDPSCCVHTAAQPPPPCVHPPCPFCVMLSLTWRRLVCAAPKKCTPALRRASHIRIAVKSRRTPAAHQHPIASLDLTSFSAFCCHHQEGWVGDHDNVLLLPLCSQMSCGGPTAGNKA
jgi:hypothetical protein